MFKKLFLFLCLVFLTSQNSFASLIQTSEENLFIINNLFFVIMTIVSMLTITGIIMIQFGNCKMQNPHAIGLTNIKVVAIGMVMMLLCGYSIAYDNVNSFIGSINLFTFNKNIFVEYNLLL